MNESRLSRFISVAVLLLFGVMVGSCYVMHVMQGSCGMARHEYVIRSWQCVSCGHIEHDQGAVEKHAPREGQRP